MSPPALWACKCAVSPGIPLDSSLNPIVVVVPFRSNASKNAIAHISSEDFRNFTELKRLDLSFNLLTELDRETFGDSLAHVEKLKLAGNAISHIYEGTFDQMPKLKQL